MKRKFLCLFLTAVFCIGLAACGAESASEEDAGAADTAETVSAESVSAETSAAGDAAADDSAEDSAEAADAAEGYGLGMADDLQALLESDYGFTCEETADGNEGESIYREAIFTEDGSKSHYVNISFDNETNQITAVDWYFYLNASDMDYWMEMTGLSLENSADLEQIQAVLTAEEELPAYESFELSETLCSCSLVQDGEGEDILLIFISKK